MHNTKKRIGPELGSLVLLAAAGLLLVIGASALPGPEYDPMGPAGLPRIIGIALLLLLGARLVSIVRTPQPVSTQTGTAPKPQPQLRRTLATAGLTVIYLMVLTLGGLPFAAVTGVYLTLLGFCMTNFSIRKLPPVIIIAAVVGIGLSYLFSDVLNIILPG
ncbi:tripartite tricarboxylate transporter TctB family protein [Marinobacterium rhizophilum]|uniref:Tripartite tricarboxylate transporter TctB family protein n=1 Tax=Marinobacterium rhizophilum TaxID=420402 RepID=A0ABY5HKX1_9GAMM|nr:tripartite tricarboxylate transporter TctB family protein [Marinobacterium rhizophilum]UTW12599.1 tripartite tricarboxylate transporter TctB family protein [Marinobacterium rhizophilum]